MKQPRINIIEYPKNALNPGGLVYALYKVYPKAKWSTGHIGRTKKTELSQCWFVGYMRSKQDYEKAINYLEEHENDGSQIRYELRQVSDYHIPEYLITDAKRDAEKLSLAKIIGRIRRKFAKRHPSESEIRHRKEMARWKRRERRYKRKGKTPPPRPLKYRRFPALFDLTPRPTIPDPNSIYQELRYLYN